MQVYITDLLKSKLDEMTRSVPSRSVPSRPVPFPFRSVPSVDDCVDVDVVSVQSVVITPDTVTFIFENNYSFVANVSSDCYYKIEVL